MEADFSEVEVTTIPKALHRVIVGAKGATVKALRKEFKVDIEVPEDKSRHATIVVGGPSANVAKCVARMEAMVAAEQQKGDAAAAAPAAAKKDAPPLSAAAPAEKKERQSPPPPTCTSSSSVVVAQYTFSFEKPAHAKLRGPRDAKRQQLAGLLKEAVRRAVVVGSDSSGGNSAAALSVSLVFPQASDLTDMNVTAEVSSAEPSSSLLSAADKASIERALLETVIGYLKGCSLAHHLRGDAATAALGVPALDGAAVATPPASNMGSRANTGPAVTEGSACAAAESEEKAKEADGKRSRNRNSKKKGDAPSAAVGSQEGPSTTAAASSSSTSGSEAKPLPVVATVAPPRTVAAPPPRSSSGALVAGCSLYRQPVNPFVEAKGPKGSSLEVPNPFVLLKAVLKVDAKRRDVFA